MECYDNFMRRMATQMYAKFTKYWSEFSLILAIAVVLDPCFKMQFVEFSYMKLMKVVISRPFMFVRNWFLCLMSMYSTLLPPINLLQEKILVK